MNIALRLNEDLMSINNFLNSDLNVLDKSHQKDFSPQWLSWRSLWTMTLQLAKPGSQSIFMSTNSWDDGWIFSYLTHIIHTHKWWWDSHYHHRTILPMAAADTAGGDCPPHETRLLHLPIMQPAGMDLQAVCRQNESCLSKKKKYK